MRVCGYKIIHRPDRIESRRRYTLYYIGERYHVHIGGWVFPQGAVVYGQGYICPCDMRAYNERGGIRVYGAKNWVGINPYSATYVNTPNFQGGHEYEICLLHPANKTRTEWVSRIVKAYERWHLDG